MEGPLPACLATPPLFSTSPATPAFISCMRLLTMRGCQHNKPHRPPEARCKAQPLCALEQVSDGRARTLRAAIFCPKHATGLGSPNQLPQACSKRSWGKWGKNTADVQAAAHGVTAWRRHRRQAGYRSWAGAYGCSGSGSPGARRARAPRPARPASGAQARRARRAARAAAGPSLRAARVIQALMTGASSGATPLNKHAWHECGT